MTDPIPSTRTGSEPQESDGAEAPECPMCGATVIVTPQKYGPAILQAAPPSAPEQGTDPE